MNLELGQLCVWVALTGGERELGEVGWVCGSASEIIEWVSKFQISARG